MSTYESDLALAQRLQAEEFASANADYNDIYNTYQRSSNNSSSNINNNHSIHVPIAQPASYIPSNHRNEAINQQEYNDNNNNNTRSINSLPFVFGSLNRMRSRNATAQLQENVANDISDITQRSRRLVILYCMIGIIELIAACVVLSISSNLTCDKPLATITVMYSARWLLLIPCCLYTYSTQRRSNTILQIKSWTDLASVLVWSVMQLWLYSSETCEDRTPILYTFDVVLVAFEYVRLLLPIILTVLLLCSLPFVLLILRYITPATQRGAKKHTIESLTTKKYTVEDANKNNDDNECSICTEPYHIDDILTVLPCKHQYHQQCIEQWLGINAVCPLCRYNINQGNNNDTEHSAAEIAV